MPQPQEPKSETLEFLKREEVRTMAKDIAQLHEEEAKKERERIAKIKPEPAESPKDIQAGPPQSKGLDGEPKPSLMPHEEHEEKVMPVLPRARTRFDKILIRVIAIGVALFILLNGVMFGYWYFTKKQVAEITPSPQPSSEATASEAEPGHGNQVSAGNLVSPTPVFFEAVQEKTIDLGPADSLAALLSNSLKEEYPQGFTRIFVKKTEDNALLTIGEFLGKTGVAMPESLLSLLEDDFMLFVYSSPARKRLGLIGEPTETQGMQETLRSWEATLEQDTRPLWEIVGQKGSAYTPFFRQTTYVNNLVRFQTFSVIDFGIVYGLVDTKLILTTSFESLTKAVDQIMQSGR